MTKKLASLVLALVMCLSLSIQAFAAENNPMTYGETRVFDDVTISFVKGTPMLLRSNNSLVDHAAYSGKGTFTSSFQCQPSYGSHLKLTIDNLNGGDVLGEILQNGSHYADFLVYGGDVGNITISSNDGSGLSTYYTVKISPVGGSMNGYFSANQYD